MKYLYIFLIAILSSFTQSFAQNLPLEYRNASEEYQRKYDVLKNEKGRGWKQFKRWQSFWKPRLIGERVNTLQNNVPVLNTYGESWSPIGPFIVPYNKLSYPSSGLGRINVIKQDPKNLNNIWLGSASGGLWKSENRGAIWTYVDIKNLVYPGITDIAIPKGNSDMLFLASGDANGYFMQGAVSSGVYYSFNKGNTWHKSAIDFSVDKQGIITSITANDDASTILIASSFGIFKSKDTCKSWNKIYNHYTRHLIQDEINPDTYYAIDYNKYGGSKFIKSTDDGNTWQEKKTFDKASRMRISQSKSKPDRLYLMTVDANNNGSAGFYISENYGESWIERENIPNILGRDVEGNSVGGQGHYDLAITVHPSNPDIVFVGGIHVWMSSDAGNTWDIKNYWIGLYEKPYMHADQHDLQFIDTVLFSANDGGIYTSRDLGENWKDYSNGLNISQVYKIFVAKNYKDLYIAGSQDNGAYHSDKWINWFHILGGDATFAEVDPESFSTWYIMSNNGVFNKTTDFGKLFKVIFTPEEANEMCDWVTPFSINTLNSNTLYLGYQNLWQSQDGGWTYDKITDISAENAINNIEISKADTNIIYFSNYTNLYSFEVDTKELNTVINQSNYAITSILSDSSDIDKFWVSFSGFNDTLKVVEYQDGNYTNISQGLPNYPVNDLLLYTGRTNFLFAATDVGVFVKDFYTEEWRPLGDNMPSLIVTDLDIDIFNKKLIAASFGMGIWSYDLPECTIDNTHIVGDSILCPNTSITLKSDIEDAEIYWSNSMTGQEIDVSLPGEYSYIAINDLLCIAYSDTIIVKESGLPSEIVIEETEDSLFTIKGYNYRWYYNDTILENCTDYAIKKMKKGNYRVELTDTNSCTVQSEVFYLPVGIGEINEDSKIKISPNPIVDYAYFSIPLELGIHTIEIYDSAGKMIDSIPNQGNYDLQSFAAGIYFIKFISKTQVFTQRLVKQ